MAERIELAHAAYAALNRGDVKRTLEFIDPQVRAHDRPARPDAGGYYGHEGILRLLADDIDAFDDVQY